MYVIFFFHKFGAMSGIFLVYFYFILLQLIIVKYINIQLYIFVYTLMEVFIMATTVRINEDVKQQLKIKSAELGVSQFDLLNRYVIEGIKRDTTPKKPVMSLDQLEKLLKHDNPKGNNLQKFSGIVPDGEVFDPVEDKRKAYRGY